MRARFALLANAGPPCGQNLWPMQARFAPKYLWPMRAHLAGQNLWPMRVHPAAKICGQCGCSLRPKFVVNVCEICSKNAF
ncbi:hypothetical protein GPALN_010303 [Globodera pallida]|nr:hypothetical protein GPALN_010303 [Globodera pallida]